MTGKMESDDYGFSLDEGAALRKRRFWQNFLYLMGMAALVAGLALVSGCASVSRVGVGAGRMDMAADAFGTADALSVGTVTVETGPELLGGAELGGDLGRVRGVVRGYAGGGSGRAPVPASPGQEVDADVLLGGVDLGFLWDSRDLRFLGLSPYLEAGASYVRFDVDAGGESFRDGAPGLYAGGGLRAATDSGLTFDLGVRRRWTAEMEFEDAGVTFDGDALEVGLTVAWGF